MKKWEELSMRERAAIIKVGVANGITNLKEIRNKFEEGGPIEQQLREQYPHYTDAQIQLLIRSRQSDKNLSEYKSKSTESSNKDYSKAAELLSGAYFLTKGALKGTNAVARRLSRTTSRHGHPVYSTSSPAGKVRETTDKLLTKMDKGQTTMSTLGFGADIAQLMQGDTSWVNNAELAGDAAGIIGGTNIVRSTPWFGRYRNAIDTTLDAMGYTAAGYDVWNYLFGE